MSEPIKRTGKRAVILQCLQKGPVTAGELAFTVYGEDSEIARTNVRTAIHHLRRIGIGVGVIYSRNEAKGGYYLSENPVCPYCKGTGKALNGTPATG